MPSERVWSRFEVKRKDGTVWKLRVQDIPQERIDDAVEILMKYFISEEVIRKAVGVDKDPESLAQYKEYLVNFIKKPLHSTVICCADEDEVKDIMAVSMMYITDGIDDTFKEIEDHGTPLLKKLKRILTERAITLLQDRGPGRRSANEFNPVKEYNLKKFYKDIGMCVVPEYRGLGIAEQLLKVRRIMCEAHGIPMTGGWATSYGTQKAGTRDGWETVREERYDYLAEKYGVTFIDTPPTMKYMIATTNKTNSKL